MPRLAFALVLTLCLAAAAQADRLLTVSGEGRVASVPDLATITLGVTNEAATAGAAMDATSAAVAAILAELSAAGIAPRDLQTSELSLWPVYDHRSSSTDDGPPKLVGFRASNRLMVRVRELETLGGLLDVVIEHGANTFQGLSFGLQEPEPVLNEARRRAVGDAVAKAKLYAKAAGVVLGPLVRLDEAGVMPPAPVMMERALVSAEAVPVAEGEVETRASVTLVYEIGGPAE